MKKTFQTLLIIVLFLIILLSFFTFPSTIMETVSFSISLWIDSLFPSLFPFLILSTLFTSYNISYLFSEFFKPLVQKIFHLPSSCGFILALSLLSGFPANAKFIKNALDNEEITIETANQLLRFCYFPNPLFVVGTVGTLFLGNQTYGFLLLISHYLSCFIIAVCFRKKESPNYKKVSIKSTFSKIKEKVYNSSSFASLLRKSIYDSLETMFLLLGIITCFLIISNLIFTYFNLNNILKISISSILEMTQGLKAISILKIPLLLRMILMSSTLSFGGICIHTQIFSILEDYSISYKSFFKARILHIILSSLFTLFLGSIFIL